MLTVTSYICKSSKCIVNIILHLPLALNFIVEPYCNTCVQVFPDCVVWHLWYKIIGGERVQESTSLLHTSDFSVTLLLNYCYSENFLLIYCLNIKVNFGVKLMVHMLQKVFVLCKMIWHSWQRNYRPSLIILELWLHVEDLFGVCELSD